MWSSTPPSPKASDAEISTHSTSAPPNVSYLYRVRAAKCDIEITSQLFGRFLLTFRTSPYCIIRKTYIFIPLCLVFEYLVSVFQQIAICITKAFIGSITSKDNFLSRRLRRLGNYPYTYMSHIVGTSFSAY